MPTRKVPTIGMFTPTIDMPMKRQTAGIAARIAT